MTGLPPHMPERGGDMPNTPRKGKKGAPPPMEHRANAHRSLPRMPKRAGGMPITP